MLLLLLQPGGGGGGGFIELQACRGIRNQESEEKKRKLITVTDKKNGADPSAVW